MSCAEDDIDFEKLWGIVSRQFQLDERSDHGPGHWKRVEQNGLLLAPSSGADVVVVRLFSLFHDSKRENEFTDQVHGRRGATYARELRNVHYQISDLQFDLLEKACVWHTETIHHSDPTIGTCWDADRLDLGRVGIIPDPKYMNTDLGRQLANKISGERKQ
jgi:uncharacterized protein